MSLTVNSDHFFLFIPLTLPLVVVAVLLVVVFTHIWSWWQGPPKHYHQDYPGQMAQGRCGICRPLCRCFSLLSPLSCLQELCLLHSTEGCSSLYHLALLFCFRAISSGAHGLPRICALLMIRGPSNVRK